MTAPSPSAGRVEPRTWSNPQQLVGATLDGRYRLKRVLGAGGMGAVFEGEQITLQKEVAIKVLAPQLAENPTYVERFLREARAASRIRNLHVVDISDFGNVAGSVYYVMELLDGRDLSRVIAESWRVPWPRAKRILLQIVHALQAAHDHGVVHRDIKPANCVIMPDPDDPRGDFVKVVDFGIAKMLEVDGTSAGLTRPNEIMGTAAYMAPEQALCLPVDVRTDVYSLGVVAFEMLTGRVPFVGSGVFDVLEMQCKTPAPTPSSLANHVSPALDHVILRSLQKRPEDRYQDMRSFESALRSIDDHGQRVADGAIALGAAPTLMQGVVERNVAPGRPGGAAALDRRPAKHRRPAIHGTRKGLSTRALVVLLVSVVAVGLVVGAWLVARFAIR